MGVETHNVIYLINMNKEEINHLLQLSRMDIEEKEKEKVYQDLAQILKYVSQLSEVETKDIEPMNGGTLLDNIVRRDEAYSSDTTLNIKLKESAPNKEGNYIKVPPII